MQNVWKDESHYKGRVGAWLGYKYNGFQLETWEKWRDAVRGKYSCLGR